MTNKYLTKEEIINEVFSGCNDEDKRYLRSINDENDLLQFHFSTGMAIRNHFLLWAEDNPLTMLDYVPEIEDGADINPKHPDAVSMDIIKEVWKRVKDEG